MSKDTRDRREYAKQRRLRIKAEAAGTAVMRVPVNPQTMVSHNPMFDGLVEAAAARFLEEENYDKQQKQEILVALSSGGFDSAMLTVKKLEAEKRRMEAQLKVINNLLKVAKKGASKAAFVERKSARGEHWTLKGFDEDGREEWKWS